METIDRFYERLVENEKIYGVLIFKDGDPIRTNMDDDTAKQFIEFTTEIFRHAGESLSRLPDLTGEINFVTITLRNGLVVLLVRYAEYHLVVVARSSVAVSGKIESLIEEVRKILEKQP